MSINVGDDIGLEIHPNVDQFLRIEEGQGIVRMGKNKDRLDFQARVSGEFTPRFHQEESRSISENVTWGQRKRFADGKVSLPYERFLGYEKGEEGLPKIIEKEAAVVRLIYKLFLEGKTSAGKKLCQ